MMSGGCLDASWTSRIATKISTIDLTLDPRSHPVFNKVGFLKMGSAPRKHILGMNGMNIGPFGLRFDP